MPTSATVRAVLSFVSVVILGVAGTPTGAAGQEEQQLPEDLLRELTFRSIGPAVTGGRIHDVEALPEDPSTLYVATASGGLWKSTNQGTTWKPLFDDQPVSTFGDVAVAPSDRDVIWAGTGEQQNRQSTSWGNGVYRSTDGGETWTHLGLEETRHIARVVAHPDDPSTAFVAALGNLWKASEQRGVYRTTDAGRSWEKVLAGENDYTGAVDLAMDPEDPDVLYAAMYQRLRRTWGFNGGGPGSGIWKSTDGGETWRELTEGLPAGEKGRIGIDVSPADPDRLYALVQHAEESGTYRSDDRGETWRKVNDLDPRPMYYSHVFADPVDPDRVYVLATEAYRSDDGGETFVRLPTRPTYDVGVHSDHHVLWIDPNDTEHFYLAGDAGLHETFDRGRTYRRINNLPIGQFYAIGLDNWDPYRVYGGMQDNHSWMGPSATRRWIGIIDDDWRQIGFGDGMYQQPDPTSHRYVYVGAQNGILNRTDAETGDRLDVRPRPPTPAVGAAGSAGEGPGAGGSADSDYASEEYRFDWVTPSLVSRHDPTTLYFGGNRLFISRDRGETWKATKDLTRGIDRDTLELMGVEGSEPMLSKHDGTASFSEITTLDESPLDPSVLWVGTDDGHVQVSLDGGRSWDEVSGDVNGVEPTVYVSRVTASRAGRGVAYAAFDAHRRGDFDTYLYRTSDYGQSWERIDEDLPDGAGPVNDLVEHPDNPFLLFAGTEHGLFVSVDAGRHWTPLGPNLPTTLYDDLAIHERENDLVAGTHGRSIWILDDLTPLEHWDDRLARKEAHLFQPLEARLFHYWKSTSYRGQASFAGDNPPFGAVLNYHLAEDADSARIEVHDPEGNLVRRLEVPGTRGVIHRVSWDLRHEPPPGVGEEEEGRQIRPGLLRPDTVLPEPKHPLEPAGPFVSPGVYRVTLVADGARSSQQLRVVGDPEMPVSDAGWHRRETFLVDLMGMQRSVHSAAERARSHRDSLKARRDSLAEDAGIDPGRAAEEGAVPEELARALEEASEVVRAVNRVQGELFGLAFGFNRVGVTQGTVYPPTPEHESRKRRLETRLSDVLEKVERLTGR